MLLELEINSLQPDNNQSMEKKHEGFRRKLWKKEIIVAATLLTAIACQSDKESESTSGFEAPDSLEKCLEAINDPQSLDALIDSIYLTQAAKDVFYDISEVRTYCNLPQLRFDCGVGPSDEIFSCYFGDRDIIDGRQIIAWDGLALMFGEHVRSYAAHEILHATYVRLPENELQTVNELVEEVYSERKQELSKVVEGFDFANNNDEYRIGELYVLLGTWLPDLPPELENHYAHYFTDRNAIVSLAREQNPDLIVEPS